MSTSPDAAGAPAATRAAAVEVPAWYQTAVIYQLHVRSFCDSDADGVGDLPGLISKLDHLQDLGVTAVWLLPFYPSPMRDDGYDIADYTGVNPMYGTMRDFKRLVAEAHDRGIRVITELVINHTSDRHPWFQRARAAPRGSREREFYVWSDDDERFGDVRIIFKDFESSNWTWDERARQYYWHRFYHHQPDLNFDNPAVVEAITRVLDFWLGLGVDGLRLDAVPYLFEREGTNCENLPETHDFLRRLRAHVNETFADRMLLAEANMWPEDAVQYFGDGDECHMAFHFPLMPRLFMSMQLEDRYPLIDVMQQTPSIPKGCQWALFLRNHDELTLEMVTDEERDYMYRAFAADPRARINVGIRRRLAPLVGNDRRRIELMNALLFSLPGTPILYYGDEIGMGDNIYLGDRDGVRTPMQWSPDRNAGFSMANPQQLHLPVIIDPEYTFESVNVESQQRNTHSLLWWMRRVIAARHRHPVFGNGSIEFPRAENPKLLAFVRADDTERVLVIANLSRFMQGTRIDLSAWVGSTPVDLFGRHRLPPIGSEPYFVTLGPHDVFWLRLDAPRGAGSDGAATARDAPVVVLGEVAPGRAGRRGAIGPADLLEGRGLRRLEALLPQFLARQRWFGGKARTIQFARAAQSLELPLGSALAPGGDTRLLIVDVGYTEGEPESYMVPVAFALGEDARRFADERPHARIGGLRWGRDDPADAGALLDAAADERFWSGMLQFLARRRRQRGSDGLEAWFSAPVRATLDADGRPLKPRLTGVEQSNSSASFEDRFMFKLYRRLHPGVNPDEEIGRFLNERARFPNTPRVLGGLSWRPKRGGDPWTLGIVLEYVPNQGDAWQQASTLLSSLLEHAGASAGAPSPSSQGEAAAAGTWTGSAALLGQRVAEMHRALASDAENPAFAPEPFAGAHNQRSLFQSLRNLLRQSLQLLRERVAELPEGAAGAAREVLDAERELVARFEVLRRVRFEGRRIRVHGDLHLGQVLNTGRDYVIVDFEGEPARPLGERRLKRSPLRDVAGMLRSFDYAAQVALRQHVNRFGVPDEEERRRPLVECVELWRASARSTFLASYLAAMEGSRLLPAGESLSALIELFELEKAAYELAYELNNRPAWVAVPLDGILRLLRQDEESDGSQA